MCSVVKASTESTALCSKTGTCSRRRRCARSSRALSEVHGVVVHAQSDDDLDHGDARLDRREYHLLVDVLVAVHARVVRTDP